MSDKRCWPRPLLGAFVAMNRQNIIGVDGKMPWHYPADLRRFKQETLGTTLIMGRLTWDSIGRKPLPGRHNVVITRQHTAAITAATCYASAAAALHQHQGENIWVIGGGQIFRLCFAHLNFLDVTLVPDVLTPTNASTFPPIDPSVWRECQRQVIDPKNDLINVQYVRQ